jgi:uncharacterized protein (TIGR02996 family)
LARKKPDVSGVAAIRDLQEDGFLRSIIAAPKDDNVRLVYADWLQEKNDPRGEFIRCQVQAAAKQTPAEEKRKLNARAKVLLAQHQWLPPYFQGKGAKIERGFVVRFARNEEAEVPSTDEVAKLAADPFFALIPMDLLRSSYRFSGIGCPLLALVVRVPRLGCFGKLDWEQVCLGSPTQDDRNEVPEGYLLCSSPHLGGLSELRLANCSLRDKQIVALANNPAVASLRVLNVGANGDMEVSGNEFKDEGAKALANSPYLNELEELDLSDAWMSDTGVKYLCAARGLSKLKRLNLAGVSLTDKGYQTLAKSPFVARLEELTVGHGYYQESKTRPTEVGLRALAKSPHLENIKRLRIELRYLSPEMIAARTELQQRFGKRVEADE